MGSGIYSLGTRAMFASQAMLDTTAHNISNVNTPGYSRQQVELATESGMYTGAGFFGRGVRIATVTRSTNEFLIKEANVNTASSAADQTRLGKLEQPMSGADFAKLIAERLGREPLHCGDTGPELIRSVAWCTGGGQSYISQAAEQGIDAFISGEASEQTIHTAREMGMHFYAAGHHATERYGIQALGQWLAAKTGIEVCFIDVPNPA